MSSRKKLTQGLLATINLKEVPFHAYASFSAFLSFLKCILEVVFCDGVQHSASITSTVSKWRVFSFIFNGENRKKLQGAKFRRVGWVGTTVMLLSLRNSLVKKEVSDGALS
jgi:hypothetical protein